MANTTKIIVLHYFFFYFVFQLAEIKVKLFEAKAALEECITLQDFNKASVLKEKITELEHIKKDLIKEVEQPEIKEMHVDKVFSLPVLQSAGYVLIFIPCFESKCSLALYNLNFLI